jgi:hypothetical protein
LCALQQNLPQKLHQSPANGPNEMYKPYLEHSYALKTPDLKSKSEFDTEKTLLSISLFILIFSNNDLITPCLVCKFIISALIYKSVMTNSK